MRQSFKLAGPSPWQPGQQAVRVGGGLRRSLRGLRRRGRLLGNRDGRLRRSLRDGDWLGTGAVVSRVEFLWQPGLGVEPSESQVQPRSHHSRGRAWSPWQPLGWLGRALAPQEEADGRALAFIWPTRQARLWVFAGTVCASPSVRSPGLLSAAFLFLMFKSLTPCPQLCSVALCASDKL